MLIIKLVDIKCCIEVDVVDVDNLKMFLLMFSLPTLALKSAFFNFNYNFCSASFANLKIKSE